MDSIYHLLHSNLDGDSSLPDSFLSPVVTMLTPRHVRSLLTELMDATDQTGDVIPQIIMMLEHIAAYHKFSQQTWRRVTIGCFYIAAKEQYTETAQEVDLRTSYALGVYLDLLKQIEADLLNCLKFTLKCETDSVS